MTEKAALCLMTPESSPKLNTVIIDDTVTTTSSSIPSPNNSSKYDAVLADENLTKSLLKASEKKSLSREGESVVEENRSNDNCDVEIVNKPNVYKRTNSKRNSQRKKRNASILYYTSVGRNLTENRTPQEFTGESLTRSQKHVHLSRKWPQWLWKLFSRSLGVKIHPNDTPLVGTILHMLTLTFAFSFSVASAWYIVLDVLSNYTRTTVLIGSVSILIGFSWVAIGIYANDLAGRLISNKNFADSVRMHSRTVFKISSTGLLFLISLVLMCVNSYHSWINFQAESCQQIGVTNALCLIAFSCKVSFGVFALIWNCMVGFILLSVCRTHTIGIRRFIRELEVDGQSYDAYWKYQNSRTGVRHVDIDSLSSGLGADFCDECVWNDDCNRNGHNCDNNSQMPRPVSRPTLPTEESPSQIVTPSNHDDDNKNEGCLPEAISDQAVQMEAPPENTQPHNMASEMMTNDDILMSYWKISFRMRTTSAYLQRWLASWIVLIVLWCANYIIFWMSHKATLLGIVEFILPLLLLLLISSAFAEANAEGQRMIRCMCPTEDRLFLLLFLNQQPLQMTVFNFALTYNAIVGILLAFSVAFASKVIMDEVVV
ncbi:uncharacterized protein LOC106876890 isoform X1 [Octopus bimaculoides]|uniref:Uncharacterized protein n=1 Tax=Octopus bimaculoides TaxID=37653 RepID=A0A0L8GIA6_OCTBM|nr:uncharacterized protein LOC106876890 isoform X1 [Octopus bimaculoides]|eukprot:XP_014781119.1 PREDICTED: uncharacterized protein LOC106876890 isoform X1 [Octopus bimaculoides]